MERYNLFGHDGIDSKPSQHNVGNDTKDPTVAIHEWMNVFDHGGEEEIYLLYTIQCHCFVAYIADRLSKLPMGRKETILCIDDTNHIRCAYHSIPRDLAR